MNTMIYYFTGTGNSYKITKDLKDNIKDCQMKRICKHNMDIGQGIYERVGFVFPVYYRGLPKMVHKFIQNLDIGKGKYFFAVANYGSTAALTFMQIDDVLKSKGKCLSANFGIEMPGNMWFMYYPHPKEDYVNRMDNQTSLTIDIANKIEGRFKNKIAGIPNRDEEEKMYENFHPSDIDENYWVNEKCNGCGVCSKACPAENIEIVDKKPCWKHKCEQCLACLHLCPNIAIEFKRDSLNRERYHNKYVKLDELLF